MQTTIVVISTLRVNKCEFSNDFHEMHDCMFAWLKQLMFNSLPNYKLLLLIEPYSG